jgi:hypothetical protein
LFTSDTNIQIKVANDDFLNKKINKVKQKLLIWFHVIGLVINTEKTIAIPFYTWQNKSFLKCEVIFKGMDIKYEYETKFLGLHLT